MAAFGSGCTPSDGGDAEGPGSETVAPERMPLVFVVHPTRPPIDVARARADAILTGVALDWSDFNEPARPVRVVFGPSAPAKIRGGIRASTDLDAVSMVERDRTALAIVAAAAAGPTVRTLTVGGADPLSDPNAYPLKIAGSTTPPIITAAFVGDVMLGNRVGDRMRERGDFSFPLRSVGDRLAAADLTVGTLESTLSRDGSPRQPSGENFAADPRVLPALRAAGFDVLSLGNNHVGDFGPRALVETVRRVRSSGIAPVGAGEDDARARAPVILQRAGIRFGFLAFNARGETPPAGASTPGAAYVAMRPYSPALDESQLRRVLDDVRTLRSRVDVLVVLPHWGAQYTHARNADQARSARALIDAGADLIVGSHPHWVQGVEIIRGRPVFYSLGNFVFDQRIHLPQTRESIALELLFWGREIKRAEFVPARIGADFVPRFQTWDAGRDILEDVWRASGSPYRAGAG